MRDFNGRKTIHVILALRAAAKLHLKPSEIHSAAQLPRQIRPGARGCFRHCETIGPFDGRNERPIWKIGAHQPATANRGFGWLTGHKREWSTARCRKRLATVGSSAIVTNAPRI